MKEILVFVYNANSDLFSTVTDFAHKMVSPATYQCDLCTLTYGNFSMKQDWKSFIEGLPIQPVFLHKDEFENQYNMQIPLPVVLFQTDESILEIISREELANCKTLEDLKNVVSKKLEEHVQHHHPDV